MSSLEATSTDVDRSSRSRSRLPALDAFRGLAVLCMIADHLALLVGATEIRLTVGRLAMPAFFLLAGYLARAPRRRHLWIGLLGVGLGATTFVESPNVLTLWALGVVLLWVLDLGGMPRWTIAAIGLGIAANGYNDASHGYDPNALWGLMALGSMLPATAFTWAGAAPRWVGWLGRHPIAVYAGHVVALDLLMRVTALGPPG